MLPYITCICLVCTAVESLPINMVLDDNLTVPGVAAIMSAALLPQVAATGVVCMAGGSSVAAGMASMVGVAH